MQVGKAEQYQRGRISRTHSYAPGQAPDTAAIEAGPRTDRAPEAQRELSAIPTGEQSNVRDDVTVRWDGYRPRPVVRR